MSLTTRATATPTPSSLNTIIDLFDGQEWDYTTRGNWRFSTVGGNVRLFISNSMALPDPFNAASGVSVDQWYVANTILSQILVSPETLKYVAGWVAHLAASTLPIGANASASAPTKYCDTGITPSKCSSLVGSALAYPTFKEFDEALDPVLDAIQEALSAQCCPDIDADIWSEAKLYLKNVLLFGAMHSSAKSVLEVLGGLRLSLLASLYKGYEESETGIVMLTGPAFGNVTSENQDYIDKMPEGFWEDAAAGSLTERFTDDYIDDCPGNSDYTYQHIDEGTPLDVLINQQGTLDFTIKDGVQPDVSYEYDGEIGAGDVFDFVEPLGDEVHDIHMCDMVSDSSVLVSLGTVGSWPTDCEFLEDSNGCLSWAFLLGARSQKNHADYLTAMAQYAEASDAKRKRLFELREIRPDVAGASNQEVADAIIPKSYLSGYADAIDEQLQARHHVAVEIIKDARPESTPIDGSEFYIVRKKTGDILVQGADWQSLTQLGLEKEVNSTEFTRQLFGEIKIRYIAMPVSCFKDELSRPSKINVYYNVVMADIDGTSNLANLSSASAEGTNEYTHCVEMYKRRCTEVANVNVDAVPPERNWWWLLLLIIPLVAIVLWAVTKNIKKEDEHEKALEIARAGSASSKDASGDQAAATVGSHAGDTGSGSGEASLEAKPVELKL